MDRNDSELPPVGTLDRQVLDALAKERGHLAFNGLRRRLDAHPESLVRSLRRLQRLGEVGKDRAGYFRTDAAGTTAGPERVLPIASVQLPVALPPEAVLGALAGRWFGDLRWVGTYDLRRPPGLVWAVPGVDGHLVLQVRGDHLKLSAEGPEEGFPADSLSSAGEELLWHVLGRLRSIGPPRASRTAPGAVAFARTTGPAGPMAPGWAS